MLSDSDRQVLDLAARTYRHEGSREQDVHDELAMSPARWAQRVTSLADDPQAWAEYPTLMKRVRRMRGR